MKLHNLDLHTDIECLKPPLEPSENAMQAAGRLSSHTYADIRSARHAYQRTRKYPHKQPRDTGYCRCCFDIRFNVMRLLRKKESHIALRHEDWDDKVTCEWPDEQENDTTAGVSEHSQHGHYGPRSVEPAPLEQAKLDSAGGSVEGWEADVYTQYVDTTEDDWEVLSDISSDT